jgi:hypothetical protein
MGCVPTYLSCLALCSMDGKRSTVRAPKRSRMTSTLSREIGTYLGTCIGWSSDCYLFDALLTALPLLQDCPMIITVTLTPVTTIGFVRMSGSLLRRPASR